MHSPMNTLSRPGLDRANPARGALLLTTTAALTFFTAGAGMLEARAVYPSWRDLATFAEFATYHGDYGRALLPWLPLPLLVATGLNAWLVARHPPAVPRGLVVATLVGQGVVIAVTATLALPLQQQLATPGHTPAEIIELLDRLTRVGYLRDVPGLAVAGGFVVMLHRAVRAGLR